MSSDHTPHRIRCHSVSAERTHALGVALAAHLRAGDVLALEGELGAGKTALVRGLAEGMGIDPAHVSSPTYVLMQEYEPTHSAAGRPQVLIHIDAYRLDGPAALESLGAEVLEDLAAHGAVLAVEWAARVRDRLGPDVLEVAMEHAPDGRRITLTGTGTWTGRMAALGAALNTFAPPAPRTSACPTCKGPVAGDSASFPFCCPRCRQLDLASWLDGRYTISRPLEQADLEEEG